jgi:AcrR family transcriptional regulator
MAKVPPKNPLKARKKPLQSRSTVTVEAIVEAAARILEGAGPAGYNTNAIGELAGVSIGSLYQYFPNKDSITRALMERERRALVKDVAAIPARASADQALTCLIEVACRHQLCRVKLADLLESEALRLPQDKESIRLTAELRQAARECVVLSVPDATHLPLLVDDVLAIIRGMVDGAGERGEQDVAALAQRVSCAVDGYILNVLARSV